MHSGPQEGGGGDICDGSPIISSSGTDTTDAMAGQKRPNRLSPTVAEGAEVPHVIRRRAEVTPGGSLISNFAPFSVAAPGASPSPMAQRMSSSEAEGRGANDNNNNNSSNNNNNNNNSNDNDDNNDDGDKGVVDGEKKNNNDGAEADPSAPATRGPSSELETDAVAALCGISSGPSTSTTAATSSSSSSSSTTSCASGASSSSSSACASRGDVDRPCPPQRGNASSNARQEQATAFRLQQQFQLQNRPTSLLGAVPPIHSLLDHDGGDPVAPSKNISGGSMSSVISGKSSSSHMSRGSSAGTPKRQGSSVTGMCANCTTRDTPRWRPGPEQGTSLCNACGLYYARYKRMKPGPWNGHAHGGSPAGPMRSSRSSSGDTGGTVRVKPIPGFATPTAAGANLPQMTVFRLRVPPGESGSGMQPGMYGGGGQLSQMPNPYNHGVQYGEHHFVHQSPSSAQEYEMVLRYNQLRLEQMRLQQLQLQSLMHPGGGGGATTGVGGGGGGGGYDLGNASQLGQHQHGMNQGGMNQGGMNQGGLNQGGLNPAMPSQGLGLPHAHQFQSQYQPQSQPQSQPQPQPQIGLSLPGFSQGFAHPLYQQGSSLSLGLSNQQQPQQQPQQVQNQQRTNHQVQAAQQQQQLLGYQMPQNLISNSQHPHVGALGSLIGPPGGNGSPAAGFNFGGNSNSNLNSTALQGNVSDDAWKGWQALSQGQRPADSK